MILVKASFEILEIMGKPFSDISPLQLIEQAGRICYKSEDMITNDSAGKFVKKLNNLNHESVIEHSAMTVKFICDRGVSHELVRHRLCSFSQESTRYCNYKSGVTFIIPSWVNTEEGEVEYENIEGLFFYKDSGNIIDSTWLSHMCACEESYLELLSIGWTPQQARSVLPNSLKTEIVMTANFREWRHVFKLRCSPSAHPQMREIMIPLLEKCKELIPVVFDDITY
jgi:thymidylate synthase (FAD)